MKKIDELKELKKLDEAGLIKELNSSQDKLFENKKKLSLDKLKNTSEIGKIKKRIARIQTILQEKLTESIVNETAKKLLAEKTNKQKSIKKAPTLDKTPASKTEDK